MTFATNVEAPPRPRRRWRKIVAAIIFAGAALWVCAFVMSRTELNRAIAEIEAADPGWRFEEIEKARDEVSVGENSALIIDSAYKQFRGAWGQIRSHSDGLDLATYPSRRTTAKQLADLKAIINAFGPAMAEFRKLAVMPRGRWPRVIASDGFTILLTSQEVYWPIMGLRAEMSERLEAGDVPGATDALIGTLNAARSVGDEPFIVVSMMRTSLDTLTLSSLERFLAQCISDEANLARLQRELEAKGAEQYFAKSMRGERAVVAMMYQQYSSRPWSNSTYPRRPSDRWDQIRFYIPGGVDRDQAAELRFMTRMIEVVNQAPETWVVHLNQMEQEAAALSPMAGGANKFIIGCARRYLLHRAKLRAMIAAVAAERYRLKFGHWPATLDDLVTEKLLSAVPLDPFDGQPLRWRESSDGRVIYSIGINGVDNPRLIAESDGNTNGWRLYDPEKRRQPAANGP